MRHFLVILTFYDFLNYFLASENGAQHALNRRLLVEEEEREGDGSREGGWPHRGSSCQRPKGPWTGCATLRGFTALSLLYKLVITNDHIVILKSK